VKWIVVFDNPGPGRVGPFGSPEEANGWGNRYAAEYTAIAGPHVLRWHVEPVAPPSTLEWW
jgi:hypothetical protein